MPLKPALAVGRRVARRIPGTARARLADAATTHPLAYRAKVWYLAQRCDVFLISFPKCGRTWLRQMVGVALSAEHGVDAPPIAFTDARVDHPDVPRILATHDDTPQRKAASELMTDKRGYRQRRVMFLARDPRDVIVSYYFHRTRRLRDGYPGSLSDFVRDDVGSTRTLIAFYDLWARRREVPRDFLLVRYEDLHLDPVGELRRALAFVGSEASAGAVERAVEESSFERMQQMEEAGTAGTLALTPPDPADRESFKVRRGKVGGYADYLAVDDAAYIDALVREQLDPLFGYPS